MKNKMGKLIYLILYALLICLFAYLGTRDYNNDPVKDNHNRFHNDYPTIKEDNKFEYLTSSDLIDFLNNGTGVVFLGDASNEWSVKYAEYLYDITMKSNIEKIYYYDIKMIKQLKNGNYYAILKALDDHLIETDETEHNLFSPSLYIVKDGSIVFHDSTTAAMNNETSVKDYWTKDNENIFKNKIRIALKEYC